MKYSFHSPLAFIATIIFFISCSTVSTNPDLIKPTVVTEKVFDDSDDPAIWIDKNDLSRSLIIGSDKHAENGGVYVFGLDGEIDHKRSVLGLKRINNVDVAYGMMLGDSLIDIVVATERDRNRMRFFRLPDMLDLDSNGIEVFVGEEKRSPMGIALYKRPSDGAMFAIVGRKDGPAENYLEQYLIWGNEMGRINARLVRKFGKFSGKKEIESIAVDQELGFVYYSDEQFGIRKYYADPEKGNEELGVFGQGDFLEDNEGISIYTQANGKGYILVSNQSANTFHIYPREGANGNPHEHKKIATLPLSTEQSDGSEVSSVSLPGFEGGIFVAMSTDGTFHYYKWSDLAKAGGLLSNDK